MHQVTAITPCGPDYVELLHRPASSLSRQAGVQMNWIVIADDENTEAVWHELQSLGPDQMAPTLLHNTEVHALGAARLGPDRARGRAISFVRTPWTMLVDSDDEVETDSVVDLVDWCLGNRVGWCFGLQQRLWADGRKGALDPDFLADRRFEPGEFLTEPYMMTPGRSMTSAGMLARTELVKMVGSQALPSWDDFGVLAGCAAISSGGVAPRLAYLYHQDGLAISRRTGDPTLQNVHKVAGERALQAARDLHDEHARRNWLMSRWLPPGESRPAPRSAWHAEGTPSSVGTLPTLYTYGQRSISPAAAASRKARVTRPR